MSILADLKVLYQLVLHPVRGNTHAERLDSFYTGQAADYDRFRQRLLQGREELYATIDVPANGVWVDMGGGTGANLAYLADAIDQLRQVYVVDLATSLLDVARRRIEAQGWNHVEAVEADATQFTPPVGPADVVTFSYSLTMIPDWFAAIDNAVRILKPGGRLGVVDFYVARKFPPTGMHRHGWSTRSGWPVWFATDNVFLSPDHVPYLRRAVETESLIESRAKVPYMPLVRVPYYRFVGRKPAE